METDSPLYAAPALTASNSGGGLVLLAGAATTAFALLGVYLLDQVGFNVMGWYGDYVIPLGAFLVGLVASSGYGLASWFTGTKISGRLLVLVALMLAAGYFLASWLEFRLAFPSGAVAQDGTPIGFWAYFDITTRGFAFEDDTTHQPGSPLGLLGYGVRALEIVGFVGGGAVIPAVLRKKPYCEACQRYERTRQLTWIAASVPFRRVSKRKSEERAAYEASNAAAEQQGHAALKSLFEAARADDGSALPALLSSQMGKPATKLPVRISVSLVHCKRCLAGELTGTLVTGQGKAMKRRPLGSTSLTPAAVSRLAS